MNYFPVFLRIRNLPCLVAGGGTVGTRKTRQLLRAGARVTVCAPDVSPELRQLAADGQVSLTIAPFAPELIGEHRFVIAATGDPDINRTIADAAHERGLFCNVVDDRDTSSAILPAIVDRSPVIVAVSSSGDAPVLATRIRQQIDTLLAPRLGDLATHMGRWRDRVKERLDTIKERRLFWQQVLNSPVASHVLHGDVTAADRVTADLLDSREASSEGIAYIVGAGPGDPELLTLKAVRALNTADVVVHDRLVARAVLDYARKDAEFISVGKQAGVPSITQDEINALLVRLVAAGKTVCRIKGGDPFIFGRGGEEIAALEDADLAWQVIPGITAAAGCAAAAGIPLTHREVARALTLTTAHNADGSEPDWQTLAGNEQTVVFYMGVRKLAATCAALIDAGKDSATPAVIIENGTTARQRLVNGTLADLPAQAQAANVKSPALLIVGSVAALARSTADNAGSGAETDESVASSHQWSERAHYDNSEAQT
ncbi:MAG: uroporphyrinogen-III C-methyltransferase [Gammaproteobacteria bacterium]|nr:uroporphyrinogen-III C-methyltransferase [Gammaproteobacteria bacterium]